MASLWYGLAAAGSSTTANASTSTEAGASPTAQPQLALLDLFFPGFSVFSAAVQRYTHIDLNLYIPVVLFFGGATFVWQYISDFVWGKLESYFMSTCLLRTDDEAYNYIMAWVAKQTFSHKSRRFIVNTNTNSRSWFTWRWDGEEDEDDEYQGPEDKKKPLSYTPTFGSHYFFYKGHIMTFHRIQNREQASFLVASQREEISLSCLGRNPAVLKELLLEARDEYLKRDEKKTSIYRGTSRAGGDPSWQRCMARTARPFSTVILNEETKQELIDDVTDYLDPATRRWYANRGIPYRRGYLLHGPPGTGKSSLSLALAGYFKMRIYIVSLSSIHANEETLSSLFNELPRRCCVLLEDIDAAGLTHTRDAPDAEAPAAPSSSSGSDDMVPGQLTPGIPTPPSPTISPPSRLSLSSLLNILDGVASQEGRVLIMTTNHIEKLDKALIRPGRVDLQVHFGLADTGMVAALFRAIYAPLEGDDEPEKVVDEKAQLDMEAEAKRIAEARLKREEAVKRVGVLADEFAAKVPAHEFSPAELQGYLMKNKRNPAGAVAKVEEWVTVTRKEKKDKVLKDAEDKRKKEEKEKKEAEEKKQKEEQEKKDKEEKDKKEKEEKEEKEKKEKEKEARRKKRKQKKKEESRKRASSRRSRKAERDASSGSSDEVSDSASDEDEAAPAKKKVSPDAAAATATAAAPTTASPAVTSEPSPEKLAEDVPAPAESVKLDTVGTGDKKLTEGQAGMDSGYEGYET